MAGDAFGPLDILGVDLLSKPKRRIIRDRNCLIFIFGTKYECCRTEELLTSRTLRVRAFLTRMEPLQPGNSVMVAVHLSSINYIFLVGGSPPNLAFDVEAGASEMFATELMF